MYLGIEIGGTKLQVGVGDGGSRQLVALERREVNPRAGAEGIRAVIEPLARQLIERFRPAAIGVGFGGPVDGRHTLKSHHVAGWERFPLVDWCRERFALPVALANDADAAALAEATLGAGRGASPVLYVTVGTGIGAGLVLDGRAYRGAGPAALELGHLRPDATCGRPEQNLEALAAGWGIAAQARERMASAPPEDRAAADLRTRAGESPSTKAVAEAAAEGNPLALEIVAKARRSLAWGLAQAITLLAPKAVVVGGGVTLMEERLFWWPLEEEVRGFAFPPLAGAFDLRRPELGEEVVVHGALLAARSLAVGESPHDGVG